jgi:hypothetical protein
MKKLNNIKVSEILTPAQMINVKGGIDLTVSVVLDDKRRDRPGGGITTL